MMQIRLFKGKLTLVTMVLLCIVSCAEQEPTDLTKNSVIPKPVSVSANGLAFELTDKTVIAVQEGNRDIEKTGRYFINLIKPSTGFSFELKKVSKKPSAGIYLALADQPELGEEGYELDINKKQVSLTANSAQGIFHGVQTLRQLLPAKIESSSVQQGPWIIAGGVIRDYPEYAYRGAMLDVARHFFGVDEVKRLIDLLAGYKINRLHLHLSDDQGWRIEIKSWPDLTVIGGSTEVGGGKGGFYSQDEYSDIVNYAASRYIMIIPEIDMPGHTNAALASYAQLNCDGKARDLYTGTDVGFSSLCTKKEITYQFINDVIGELARLTPGPYIHIGGDESHATKKEDYIPFIGKVQKIVAAHNKIMIGWDEIAFAGLDRKSIAQYWSSADNAKRAASKRIKLIMSPAKKAYVDMKYDSLTTLGLHWAGYIEVDTGYNWDPATLEEGISRQDILGIEAPLWTETVTKMADIEYLFFPRLPGYAEIGWTPVNQRNWDGYKTRLASQGERFDALGINFYKSPKVPWPAM